MTESTPNGLINKINTQITPHNIDEIAEKLTWQGVPYPFMEVRLKEKVNVYPLMAKQWGIYS